MSAGSVETRIQNLPSRLRGATNKVKYGGSSPQAIVSWLKDEALWLENAINNEAARERQQKLGIE